MALNMISNHIHVSSNLISSSSSQNSSSLYQKTLNANNKTKKVKIERKLGFLSSPSLSSTLPSSSIHSKSILSGHYMVSEIEEEDDKNDYEDGTNEGTTGKLSDENFSASLNFSTRTFETLNNKISIDVSLSKLFKCMKLAYNDVKLTSPKWKTFKGLKMNIKDKIRLNNIIWRAWHIQYISGLKPVVCQFSSQLDTDRHKKTETILLEGKYWKRRVNVVKAEYKKWRRYYQREFHKSKSLIYDSDNDLPRWSNNLSFDSFFSLGSMTYTELSNQNNDNSEQYQYSNYYDYASSREIARSGMGADFMQPILEQLQPSLDFIDIKFEPIQDFINRVPLTSVQEEALDFAEIIDLKEIETTSSAPIAQENQSLFGSPPLTNLSFSKTSQLLSQQHMFLSNENQINGTVPPSQSSCNDSMIISMADNTKALQNNFNSFNQANLPPVLDIINIPGISMTNQILSNDSDLNGSNKMEYDESNLMPTIGEIQQQQPQTFIETVKNSFEPVIYSSTPSLSSSPSSYRNETLTCQPSNSSYFPMYSTPPVKANLIEKNPRRVRSISQTNPPHESSLLRSHQLHQHQSKLYPLLMNSMDNLTFCSSVPSSSSYHQENSMNSGSLRQNQQGPQPSNQRLKINQIQTDKTSIERSSSLPIWSNNQNKNNDKFNQTKKAYDQSFEASQQNLLDQTLESNQNLLNTSNYVQQERNHYETNSAEIHQSSILVDNRSDNFTSSKNSKMASSPEMSSSLNHQNLRKMDNFFLMQQQSNIGSNGGLSVFKSSLPTPTNELRTAVVSDFPTTSRNSYSNFIPIEKNDPFSNLPKKMTNKESNTRFGTNLEFRQNGKLKAKSQQQLETTNKTVFESLISASKYFLEPPRSSTVMMVPAQSLNFNSLSTSSSFINQNTSTSPINICQCLPAVAPSSSSSSLSSFSYSILKSDSEKFSNKERKRVCHINAEQKRRCNIKNGFDTLRNLLPGLSQNQNFKTSKAAMLNKAADYIRLLKNEKFEQQNETDLLKQKIESLNETIRMFQNQLPATGTWRAGDQINQIKAHYSEYVKRKTLENWKFWIFSIIMESLLESYSNTVTTSNLEEMQKTLVRWIEQNCCLITLRKDVLNSLRYVSTSTNILTNPESLQDEIMATITSHKTA